ncbi:MAG: DUF2304 domain-containing protein [Anaerolineaceae bacterium]|nr:DUF2304 domain-containing protein [Anaerolineaceae bacterium]MCY3936557.1 DUF2304 domain-containing protein [Chloroflexota bacterium]MCY4009290.1 DUF2304 domain-containing protein [Anaerolineaceae bacterium]
MASERVMIFGFIMALALLLFVLELVRRRRLREELALLWLATALIVMVLSISRASLDRLAALLGIATPTSALFLVAILFMLFMLLHVCTLLSRIMQENKSLAQQLAILQREQEDLADAMAVAETGVEARSADPGSEEAAEDDGEGGSTPEESQ